MEQQLVLFGYYVRQTGNIKRCLHRTGDVHKSVGYISSVASTHALQGGMLKCRTCVRLRRILTVEVATRSRHRSNCVYPGRAFCLLRQRDDCHLAP